MNTYTRTIVVMLIMLVSHGICAQSDFFQTIEQNNARLKALREANKSTISEVLSENTLGETSVEYTPFYLSGVEGMASSELVVSQEFEFPTVYASRRKSVRREENLLDKEYLMACREVFYEAGNLYYDLQLAKEKARILQQRKVAADSLLYVVELSLKQGRANVIEVNKVRLERMTLQTELVDNKGTEDRLKVRLEALGWCGDVMVSDSLCLDAMRDVFDEVAVGEARVALAKEEVQLQKQSWLPKLTLGYRRNTELLDARYNGFLVGASLPLFSNSRKVKAARMRVDAAEEELSAMRKEKESRQMEIMQERENLQHLLKAYDMGLMRQSLELMLQATVAGEMTISNYYVEADKIYAMVQKYHEVRTEYRKSLLRQVLVKNR